MSSHPGSTLNSAIELAEYLRDTHYQPEQVQDFYPTPGTLSTTMFYTGIDPLTMKPVYVPKSKRDKAMQRALLQYRAPRNYDLVYSALVEAGREDLIGFGHRCLIKPKMKSLILIEIILKKMYLKEQIKTKKLIQITEVIKINKKVQLKKEKTLKYK